MKFMHLSDLHLGKHVHEYNMTEDQRFILSQISQIADEESIDALLIAGDIYDKTTPPIDAVTLWDEFLWTFAKKGVSVWIISGNHDSPERLSFGRRLMCREHIHIAPPYAGKLHTVTVSDAYGDIDISLLPFIKPSYVKSYFPDAEIHSYTDALRLALQRDTPNDRRSILIAHQFVIGAKKCESEDPIVGGLDAVDASVFEGFDYVALGHIHSPQQIGRETLRYCGTPLKYSFSELNQEKSATIVTMKEKGRVTVEKRMLHPRRDLKQIKGTYEELTLKSFYENTSYPEDYLYITLTDEEDIPDAVSRLQVIYPYIMKLDYENTRTRRHQQIEADDKVETKSPLELFSEFYERQNNQPLSDIQKEFMTKLIENTMEEEE